MVEKWGQNLSDVAGIQRKSASGWKMRANFGDRFPLWTFPHLYSCLSHRVATPVVVFAVPWISQKPPLCVCQKCFWMVAHFTVQCNCLWLFHLRKRHNSISKRLLDRGRVLGNVCSIEKDVFSFLKYCSWANTGRSLVSGVYFSVNPPKQQEWAVLL